MLYWIPVSVFQAGFKAAVTEITCRTLADMVSMHPISRRQSDLHDMHPYNPMHTLVPSKRAALVGQRGRRSLQ